MIFLVAFPIMNQIVCTRPSDIADAKVLRRGSWIEYSKNTHRGSVHLLVACGFRDLVSVFGANCESVRLTSYPVGSGKTFIAYVQAPTSIRGKLMLMAKAQLLSNRSRRYNLLVISSINLPIVIK